LGQYNFSPDISGFWHKQSVKIEKSVAGSNLMKKAGNVFRKGQFIY
jgi:hypothetical protein